MGNLLGGVEQVAVNDLVDGRYRIQRLLGEGGMGSVFLAEHTLIKRRVAIKILHPQLATDEHVVECFMNEAKAAGTLGHPNIVESTDMGFTEAHIPYIVFEYLEGVLLTDEIYRVGGLPVRRAVWVAQQIAAALRAAHDAGIVHRDLKSDNVFLTDKDDASDHVKVLDFGISHFMDSESAPRRLVMGTPEFMAPEQLTSPETVDHRADIYALGVILYEMLAARRPFIPGDHPNDLPERIVGAAPAPLRQPNVPHALTDFVVERMLAKDPAHRPQSMGAVIAALDAFLTREDGTPVPRRRTGPIETASSTNQIPRAMMANTPWPSQPMPVMRPPAPAKRPVALYAIAGGGVIVGALGLMLALKGGDKAAAPPAPAPAPAPAAAIPPPAPKVVSKVAVVLSADAPNAHVVFRRRVTPAPMHTELDPTTIVELVEIDAPGYKTQSYWLTLDRPTHLVAHMTKGNGAIEASEQETLVALGEAAPQSEVAAAAPAAAPDRAAYVEARTVPPKARSTPDDRPALAPRKIGRATDVNVSVDTPAEPTKRGATDVAHIETAAVPEPPAPAVPEPPAPPVATPPPAAPPPVVAKVEPARTVSPVVMKKLRQGGEMHPEVPHLVVQQMVREEHKRVTAVVKVCIGASGDVTSATTLKSSGYSGYDDSLVAAMRASHFQPYVADGNAVPACSALSYAYAINAD